MLAIPMWAIADSDSAAPTVPADNCCVRRYRALTAMPPTPPGVTRFAAAAANRVTPGGVGGMAVNARYLRTQQLSAGTVGAALSLSAMAHIGIASIGFLAVGPRITKLPLAHSLLTARLHGVPVIV